MPGGALVFHPDSFASAAFSPVSWLGLAIIAPPATAPAGGVRRRPLFRPLQAPAIEWDSDEDEALLLCTRAL